MDMDMDSMGSSMSSEPLTTEGVDFSNTTQAAEFLDNLLDDTRISVIGNTYARYFWYGVIVVIGIAAIFNFLRWLTLQMRLREAAQQRASPAKPKTLPMRWFATITAMGREATYLQSPPTVASLPYFKVPPMGTITLLVAYLAFVLALEFVNNNVEGAQYWQALGIRAGWLAVAQVPLLVLLINKNNIIGLLTGASYERLNVIHRWSARIMLLLAIFHFAFQSTGWQKYGLTGLEWRTDECPKTGIAAFAILLWMNLTTAAPMRYFNYEFFVVQHIITFFGFIVAIMLHLPSTALTSRVYIYIPIAVYLLDRIIRTARLAWNNIRAGRAALSLLDGGVTKVRVSCKTVKYWRPGSHAIISMPRFGFMQSHPATIVSTPQPHGGDLVFILKSHKGFTKRIMENANSSATALISKENGEDAAPAAQVTTHRAFIDGPYGGSQSDFAAFDSICLIAGSTGVTFSMSVLQGIADRATHIGKRLPVQRIHFVWCVKDTDWASWISEELAAAYGMLQAAGIELIISIYVTCADKFTSPGSVVRDCACECDKSKGPCCCVAVDEDEKGEVVDKITPTKAPISVRDISSSAASRNADTTTVGRRMPILPCAVFYSGRPQIGKVLSDLLDNADGEAGVAACGPPGLTSEVRNTVVRLSDERAIHKGTGAQGCYLHVESSV
ncbi:hypothetical protein M409DRAFT_68349 [Zasmidium cellare ATCC 36951]|uniref:FAD-binding FR-type domain-containing protein n=1 Tax=Zasmidium cellare ATCC 36951 TaxID=1080233 RepID=A0A6A6C9R0_ZASCE|nr:uncharacterized protein M409DRAFT_68349 [Zasmidium cellare ATCC 36951]KAF2163781.1 hypothetical protein M409DRAFT_68349 [Zasmidium cellare ATCC 36951]